MYVMTVDQRRSQSGPDAVPSLDGILEPGRTVRPFERTAGDEVQGLLDDATAVVDFAVALLRTDEWSIGIGVGDVDMPLASSVRANKGPAFVAARRAVERAKTSPGHIAVEGADGERAEQVETVLILLAMILGRRSVAGWEAVDIMTTSATQAAAASRLGISAQAMNRRLRVAGYVEEQRARALAVHLLGENL